MANKGSEYVKQRTQELYDSLPMDKEERMKSLKIRDEIISLNYKFFGYVAKSTFVEDCSHEEKFQTALMSFLGMWWKYKWTPKYRADLSFAVFFKPRISEEIKRYLGTVSYSTKRALCLKASDQLGKPWTEIKYEDLNNVNLPHKDLQALKVIFGATKPVDISEMELFLEAPEHKNDIEYYQTTKYNTLEELLIQEMIEQESKLSDKHLHYLSEVLDISYEKIKATLPKAMKILHDRLTENL